MIDGLLYEEVRKRFWADRSDLIEELCAELLTKKGVWFV